MLSYHFIFIFVFVLNNQVHAHNTRQAEKFHVILHNSNVRAFSIQVYGVKLWNDLSLDLINCQTLAIFKRQHKTVLFSNCCMLMLTFNWSYLMLSSKVLLHHYYFSVECTDCSFYILNIYHFFHSMVIIVTLLVTKQLQRLSVNYLNTYSAILCKIIMLLFL